MLKIYSRLELRQKSFKLKLGHKGKYILQSNKPKSKAPSIYTIQTNILQRMIIVINFKYLV
jgi:hypothetical protein